MSLLLLKTRDLTWQDHTLNTEVMLAPARSGLLLNKHKTLGAKCEMDKQLYERQRAQCVKDFLSSRRLIDRQRQKLIQRQKELGTKQPRVHSAGAALAPRDTSTPGAPSAAEAPVGSLAERSASAPGAVRSLNGLPAIYIDTGTHSPDLSDSSSFFVTELHNGDKQLPAFPLPSRAVGPLGSSTPLNARSAPGRGSLSNRPPQPQSQSMPPSRAGPSPKPRNFTSTRKSTPPSSTRTPTRGRGSVSPASLSRLPRALAESGHSAGAKLISPITSRRPSFNVRFAESANNNNNPESLEEIDRAADRRKRTKTTATSLTMLPAAKETMKDPAIEARVRAFIDDIHQFTTSRRLGKATKQRPDLWPGMRRAKTDLSTPLVAKRYNSWTVDQDALLAAFDQFCNVQTPEELARVMRTAAKLKASVKLTRNQSIVPSVAVFKGTRAFKSLLARNEG